LDQLANSTEGYSCSDLTSWCKDAAMEPIRELGMGIKDVGINELRPIVYNDFKKKHFNIYVQVLAKKIFPHSRTGTKNSVLCNL